MNETVIKVDSVSKTFKLPHEKKSSIKGAFVGLFSGKRTFEKQQVLNDVSFEIRKGEFFGIVGKNGSGKSTLLKLLAGIYSPNIGSIQINGSLTPFIELGVGFNPELTGRENVFLNGALLGFNRNEVNKIYDDIVEFAELEKFMDQKLKNYSSGMQVRLAFSIAIQARSEILLIDEVLAVGDAAFQSKCFDYFYKLKKEGATVVFVSHDRSSLERFCDRGILINNGQMIESGAIDKVLKKYTDIVLDELSKEEKRNRKNNESLQITSVVLEIKNVMTLGSDDTKQSKFEYGESVKISYDIFIKEDVEDPIFGVTVWQENVERAVIATNTLIDGKRNIGKYKKGEIINFEIEIPGILNDGLYSIEPAIANNNATVFYAQKRDAFKFIISGSRNPHSVISIKNKIIIKKVK